MVRGQNVIISKTLRTLPAQSCGNPPRIVRKLYLNHWFPVFLIVGSGKFHSFHLTFFGRLLSPKQI